MPSLYTPRRKRSIDCPKERWKSEVEGGKFLIT
jgi:hypothetical protein